MGGKDDDRYHAQVEREWATNRPPRGDAHGEARPAADDSPLLHPANEGHDKERKLDRVEAWSAEESADAEATRRAREMDPSSHVQGGPLGAERFVDQTPESARAAEDRAGGARGKDRKRRG